MTVFRFQGCSAGRKARLHTGAFAALDGERQLAIGQAKTDLVDPILTELRAWREQLALGFEGNIGGAPFVISGIKPTPPIS